MAIFTPRTFNEIIGEMISRLIATTPLTDINYGSVWTTLLEAAAQEDDEQYFQMLEIIRGYSIDTTSGTDLDDRAFEYGLTRKTSQFASSTIIITDTSFTKVSTGVYSGLSGPAAGTAAINGDSRTNFPDSGSIIIGRGTPNAETVAYSSITIQSNYVIFNLSGNLANDHGTDETIILSQGGNRIIPAGTTVFVPASDISGQIDFATDDEVTILDGEDSLTGIAITALTAGSSSNVPIGAISQFDSTPFAGAIVTNNQRITNGTDQETDQELRDRIKDTIQSLSRGTGKSIITNSLTVVSSEQNRRVVSASLVEPTSPADVVKLYIDDGTGFIPTSTSVGFEEVVASATGGESFLKIDNVPLVKASVETNNSEPFNLVGTETLFVDIGGKVETITFNSTDFEILGQATAQEVLTRINTSGETFEARASSGGSKVRIFSRKNSGEEIQVTGGTSNTALGFPTDKKFTTNLYRDRGFDTILLSKDGTTASIESGGVESYDFSSVESLTIVIDGDVDNPHTVFFSPSDFDNPSSVTSEELVVLINNRVSGLIASTSSNGTRLSLTSGTERSDESKVKIIDDFDIAWNEESAVLVARESDFSNPLTTTSILASDDDEIYLGLENFKYYIVHFKFDTVASSDCALVFELWNGSTWTAVGVTDTTNGFQQNGYISFGRNDFWDTTTVNGSNAAYFLRITRTADVVTTTPIVDSINISSANDILDFSQVEAVGSNSDYTLNRFIGQIELATPLQADDRITLGSSTTRSSVVTASDAPYGLSGGEILDIDIDGVSQSYTFVAGDFGTPGSATAQEVVDAINTNFSGITATVQDTTKVKIVLNTYSENGTLQVTGGTANALLSFPVDLRTNLIPHYPALESGVETYSFNVSTSVVIIIDGNLSDNFTVPCNYASSFTGVTSDTIVVDSGLTALFPNDTDLVGYEFEMTSGDEAGERKTIASYTASTGTITLNTALSGVPSIGEDYEILPTDAEQVVKLWNKSQITTLSSKAEIKVSAGGTKVQVASKTSGEEGKIQVSGGLGNSVLGFSIIEKVGVNGYRYFTGLAQEVQKTIDGVEDDDEFPGIRAAGVQVEVIEPVVVNIEVDVSIVTQEGTTLSSIQNEIESAISTVINNLPVGGDVIVSEIVCAVKEVQGVFDVTLTRVEAPGISGTSNIPIADSELARVAEEDINVG